MNVQINYDSQDFDKRLEALKHLGNVTLEVGLPDSVGGQAQFIMAIQEHGSPVNHIPARPVIKPALAKSDVRQNIANNMKSAVETAWGGDDEGAIEAVRAAGQAGADGIRAFIDAYVPPPNSPLTIQGGWFYNKRTKKAVHVRGKGFDKPLYDSGGLYNSFTYEVKE